MIICLLVRLSVGLKGLATDTIHPECYYGNIESCYNQVFQEIVGKGNKIKDDPKCPAFLGVEVKKASELWEETNNLALDRLNRLRGPTSNLSSGKMSTFCFQTIFLLGRDMKTKEMN